MRAVRLLLTATAFGTYFVVVTGLSALSTALVHAAIAGKRTSPIASEGASWPELRAL
jgi:hypothetical protein